MWRQLLLQPGSVNTTSNIKREFNRRNPFLSFFFTIYCFFVMKYREVLDRVVNTEQTWANQYNLKVKYIKLMIIILIKLKKE